MLQTIRWLVPNMTVPSWTQIAIAIAFIIVIFVLQQYVLKPILHSLVRYFQKVDKPFVANVWHYFGRSFRHALLTASFFFASSYTLNVWLFDVTKIEKFFYSLMLYFVFKAVYDIMNYYTANPAKIKLSEHREEFIAPYLIRIAKAVMIAIAIFSIAALWSFNVNGFLTGIGLTGVALAFGIRDTSSHIFGGLSVGLDKPFQIGDWIATDDQKLDGTVKDVNLRSTLLDAGEKGLVYVPNAFLMNRPIYNYSKRQKLKTEMHFFIDLTNDEQVIRTVCEEIHEQIMLHEQTEKDVVHVFIDDFTPNAFRLLIRFFVATDVTATNLAVRQDIIFAVHDIFKRHGVTQLDTQYTTTIPL